MNWGANAKEVEAVVFHEEIGRTSKYFTNAFLTCQSEFGMMIVLFCIMPSLSQVRTSPEGIEIPICHTGGLSPLAARGTEPGLNEVELVRKRTK